MTILKNNHKSGINKNNIKVATVTEEQQASRFAVKSGFLPIISPILPITASVQVYQVDIYGDMYYPDHPECNSLNYIFCKVDVTAGAKFKTISKAMLKIQKYAGNESGEFGVYQAGENVIAFHDHHTNYLKTVTQNDTTYAVIDISEYVKEGKSKTFYLAIKSEDGNIIKLYNTATVEVSYIENDDLIPSGKLEKQVGSKGGYSINARNGKLQYSQQIFASKGGLMPFGLSLSYNASNCDSSNPNDVANSMKGWTFNYQQSLKQWLNDMLYVDASNVVHTFKHPTNNNTVWYDATGKNGMVLVATDTGYTMSDGKTATLKFDASKRLVSVEQKLSSSKTIATAIEYASDGKISKVTDGLGDVYNFTWTDTLIQVKKEIAADDAVTETLLAEITLADERVMQVKYCLSGDTVHFAYDSNSQLISVLDSASHQKALFEYNAVGAISAVKNHVRNVDDEGQVTDVATDSNHFKYKLLQTRIASCRNSDYKANAYCTMAYLFAEDGELLTTAEVKDSALQPLRFRTKLDFEKSSSTIPDKLLAQALFSGEETTQTTAGVSSDTFVVDTSNQVFNTYLFSASACISSNNYVADDNQKMLVQIVEGSQILGSALFDPSKRETESVCGTITLSPGAHTLQAKLVLSNLTALVDFGHVKLYATKNGTQKQYVNAPASNNTATEHDGTNQTTWYQHDHCSLLQDDVVLAENVIFNAKDYALTLISRLQNPTSFNVWYNDGKNMLYQVSNVSLEWPNGGSQTLENLKVCTLSSTLGKTLFQYVAPHSVYLYQKRLVTTVSTGNALSGTVSEECINSDFQKSKTVDEHGITTNYTHNAYGSVIKVKTTSPTVGTLNIEQNSTYNDKQLTASSVERRYLDDYTQSFVYGDYYQLTQDTQPNGLVTQLAYSPDKDKLTSIFATVDEATSQNDISYDGDLVDTLSDTRTAVDFAYDERHNISQVKIANEVVLEKQITYNSNGTTQSVTTYGNGQVIKKYYDKFDRLIKVSDVTDTETVLVQYIYNDTEIDSENFDPATFSPTVSANSPLRVVVDHSANTTTWYTYDQFGQVKKVQNNKITTTQTLDEFNRVNIVAHSFGGNFATSYTYASPTDDTLVAESTGGEIPIPISTTYAQDGLQRPTETTVMHGDFGYKQAFEYIPRQTRTWVPTDGFIPIIRSESVDTNVIKPPIGEGYWRTDNVGTTQYVSTFKEYAMSGSTETLVRTDAIEYD
ncbi:MAG: hypothetical protein IJX23_03090, partial [Clostridia bacterium]|nr:hypothetical protein [Clostridia bacterium]